MYVRLFRSIAWPGLLVLACAAPPAPPPPDDPSVLARFQGGEVSIAELDAYLQQAAAAASDSPPSDAAPSPAGEGGENVAAEDPRIHSITEIAVDEALASEAGGWQDPALIAQRNASIELAAQNLLLELMKERQGWTDPELSQEELRAYFDAHPELYAEPRRARLQHIFLRAETGVLAPVERQQVRQRLEAVRQEVVSGADFTALVRQHSESATATGGGFMTLDATARVPLAFSAAVWGLEVNAISEVVDAGNGFHLIKLRQIFEPAQRSFEESLEHVRRKGGQAKVRELQQQLIREVGPKYGLERHYGRLSNDPDDAEPAILIHIQGVPPYTLRDFLSELHEAFQEQLFQGYTKDVHRLLDQVAANRLLVLEAKNLKLEEEPEVARQLAESARHLRTQAALRRRLELAVAAVPESEMRDYFEQNEDRYQTLRNYGLTVIHLKPRRGDSFWQTLKRGEEMVARIRGGEDMESLAREHSRHYSASVGGKMRNLTDVGVRTRIQATAKFRRQLEVLEPGQVSDPFLSECYDPSRLLYVRTGVFIVRLDARYEPIQQSFEDMAEAVRQNYLRRNHQHLVTAARQQVAEEIGLEIFADRLPPI